MAVSPEELTEAVEFNYDEHVVKLVVQHFDELLKLYSPIDSEETYRLVFNVKGLGVDGALLKEQEKEMVKRAYEEAGWGYARVSGDHLLLRAADEAEED